MEFLTEIQPEGAGSVTTAVLVDVVVEVVVDTSVPVVVIESVSKRVVVVEKVPVAVEAVIVVVVYVCTVSVAVTAGWVTVEPGVEAVRTTTTSGCAVRKKLCVGTDDFDEWPTKVLQWVDVTCEEPAVMVKYLADMGAASSTERRRSLPSTMMDVCEKVDGGGGWGQREDGRTYVC